MPQTVLRSLNTADCAAALLQLSCRTCTELLADQFESTLDPHTSTDPQGLLGHIGICLILQGDNGLALESVPGHPAERRNRACAVILNKRYVGVQAQGVRRYVNKHIADINSLHRRHTCRIVRGVNPGVGLESLLLRFANLEV